MEKLTMQLQSVNKDELNFPHYVGKKHKGRTDWLLQINSVCNGNFQETGLIQDKPWCMAKLF